MLTAESLCSSALRNASVERQRILEKVRQTTLLRYYTKNNVVINKELFEKIFKPKDGSIQRGFSHHVQNCAFLSCFLQDRPEILADVILKNFNSPNFSYYVSVLVPSLFCYFSSEEQLQTAQIFYLNIIEKGKPEAVAKVLQPLFTSDIMFRFKESVINEFFPLFLSAVNQTHNPLNDNLIKTFAELLLNICVAKSTLIPIQLHHLWISILERNWSKREVNMILIGKLIIPQIVNMIPTNIHNEILLPIIKAIPKCSKEINKLSQALASEKVAFTIPSMYSIFGEKSVQLFLNVKDIIDLAKMLDKNKMLPDSVTYQEFTEIPKKFYDYTVLSLIFPRKRTNIKKDTGESIFNKENSLEDPIERFLSMQFIIKEMKTYEKIVDSSVRFESQSFFAKAVAPGSIPADTFYSLFDSYSIFLGTELRKEFFLTMLSEFLRIQDSSVYAHLETLDRMWNSSLALNVQPDYVKIFGNFGERQKCAFDYSIKQMSSFSGAPLYTKYCVLMKVATAFKNISDDFDGNKIIFPLLVRGASKFLASFVVISIAMKNSRFNNIQSPESSAWLWLEGEVTECLVSEPELYIEYMETVRMLFRLCPV